MGWFSSLFTSSNNQNLRKGQAISSTHEAFSLPTSSPTLTAHPDAFNPDTLNTPDLESASSPSYTYPPQGSSSYGYMPTSVGSRSRPPSLLPFHRDSLLTPGTPPSSYPPLSHTWNRLHTWLSREYPELGDTLNYGIPPQDLAQIEMQFGFALPAVVRESYLAVNGQEAESAAGCSEGLFFGLTFLPLEDVLEEWRYWREVDDDPATGGSRRLRDAMQSIPPGWVRKEFSQRGWIPLITDKVGNYIGVDLNPAESGAVGQVIVFGREFDTKVVLWRGDGPAGWAKWLASFVEELESGEGYEIGAGNDQSEGSEDDVGYESYFYEGSGRGQGDGGGDSGSGGGLRLTGEYRGWSVLEAWADRSLRRWYDIGLLPDASLEKGKAAENVGLGVLDIADIDKDPSAEVPIPVLAKVDAPSTAASSREKSPRPPPLNLPAISVTKPPAPLPVELPTPREFAPSPSPPESIHSFDDDLESGRGVGMREISREHNAGLVTSKRSHNSPVSTRYENADASGSTPATLVPLPISPIGSPLINAGELSPSPPDIPDLLVDSASPALDTAPIVPTTPLRDDTPSVEVKELPNQGIATELQTDNRQDTLTSDLDVTVRLVGGGGQAGIVDAAPQPPDQGIPVNGDTDLVNAASIVSTSNKDTEKKHKKTKSGLAGLKKLGHLGLRKKGSSSSIKDAN